MKPVFAWIAAAASALLLGCAPAGVRVPPSTPPAERPEAPSAVLSSEGGTPAVALALARELLGRIDGTQSNPTAVGWDMEEPSLATLGADLARSLPKALTLAELGVTAGGAPEAYSQLDPASFSFLLWLSPETTPEGALRSIQVELRKAAGATTLRFEIRPPLVSRIPTRTAEPVEPGSIIATAEGPIRALAWETGPPARLWILGNRDLLRTDPADGTVLQKWNREAPQGPAGLVWDEADPPRLALLEPETSDSRWFARGSGGMFAPGGKVEGFPMGPRTSQFLSAQWDPEAGAFLLFDYAGRDLGSFVQMVKAVGPGGTHFLLLDPGGNTAAVRGSDLARIPGPAEGAGALAAAGSTLFLSMGGSSPRIEAFDLVDGRIWERVWTSPPLEAVPTCLCAFRRDGTTRVLAGIARDGRGFVLSFTLPAPPP